MACMAYVDLNPIRAGLSETPEESDYTSNQERIRDYVQARDAGLDANNRHVLSTQTEPGLLTEAATNSANGDSVLLPASLAAFAGTVEEEQSALPFTFADYLDLVDWTGRAVRSQKRGAISEGVPPILKRLGVETENWIDAVRYFRRHFYHYVEPAKIIRTI